MSKNVNSMRDVMVGNTVERLVSCTDNKNVKLTSGLVVQIPELVDRLTSGEVLYGYFNVDNEIVVREITLANYDKLPELSFNVSKNKLNSSGYMMVLNEGASNQEEEGEWLFCHELVDKFLVESGLYGNLTDYKDTDDYKNIVHHIDGNTQNNNPENLIRVSKSELDAIKSKDVEELKKSRKEELDRLRVSKTSRTQPSREYSRLIKVAVEVKRTHGSLTEEVYNTHKYEFSGKPTKWSRLMERFGSVEALNEAVDTYNTDIVNLNKKSRISIYAAGPFFNEKQVATIREMERVLESRGYDVYSPSRDGIMLTPNASKADRMKVFTENVENCIGQDLVIAVVDDRDQGTMIEIGMKYGYWHALKQQGLLPEGEKVPRMITFSNDGWDLNIMLLGAVLKHCKGFDELCEYLDYVDAEGLDNIDIDSSVYTERCF